MRNTFFLDYTISYSDYEIKMLEILVMGLAFTSIQNEPGMLVRVCHPSTQKLAARAPEFKACFCYI